MIVLAVSAIAFVTLAVMSREFRGKLADVNEIEGRRKAFLFEILNGIATIKTLALEPRSMMRWRRYSDEAATKTLSLDHTSARARSVIASLERGMSVGIGAARRVVRAERPDDGRRARRLQHVGVAARPAADPRLDADAGIPEVGSVAEAAGAVDADRARTGDRATGAPRSSGHIEFEDVTFHYPGSPTPGDQGHLVRHRARPDRRHCRPQRLRQDDDHPADPGPAHAAGRAREHRRAGSEGARSRASAHPDRRRSAGELSCSAASVRENIAMTKPAASLDEVVRAAQLAGAHEFIQRLPHGYSTMLDESAANLSGGQRQRLAIARALIHDPPVLIFDEATSSLDPESEAIIQQHLAAIARGRTIVIVTHRLSFVARADAIIVVDGGHLAQVGPHEALLGSCLPYNQLWSQQARVYQ